MPIATRTALVTRRTLLSGGLLTGIGLVAGACVRTPTASSDSTPTGGIGPGPSRAATTTGTDAPAMRFTAVVVIGDSITAGSQDAIRAAFQAEGIIETTIDAEVGRRIQVGGGPSESSSGIQAATSVLESAIEAEAWVVALGTNDVGAYADEEYGQVVRSMLDLVPAGMPLVWVDVYLGDQPERSEVFNDVVASLLDERGDATLAAWSAACTATGADVLEDDVHPNETGTTVFAGVVVTALRELSGSGG